MSDQTPNLYVHGSGFDPVKATPIEMLEAAGLTTTCPTCGGDGQVEHSASQEGHTLSWDVDCPNCDARGWLLDPDRLEAALTAANQLNEWDEAADAAVLAFLENPER